MDEQKYKESIEQTIGDEQLFTQQLKGRILTGLRKKKSKVTRFKKLTPVLIALLLFIGGGTFLYFNVSAPSKQVNGSSNDGGLFDLTDDAEETNNQNEFASSTNKEKVPTEITFGHESEQSFNVPIASIPVLENYLAEAMDIQTELQRIQAEYLNWNQLNNDYYVVKYGCGNKLCDLVLVQIRDFQIVNSVYLGNGMLMDSKIFEKKAMLRIAVDEGNTVVRHQIMLLNIPSMEKADVLDKNRADAYFNEPLFPITDYKMITANTIVLEVADIPDTTYESIEKWYQTTNPPVKRVEFTVK